MAAIKFRGSAFDKTSTSGLQTKLGDTVASKIAWRGNPISPGSTVSQRLKGLGMSDAGIRQLSAGQPILNKNDQAIVTGIVVAAIG